MAEKAIFNVLRRHEGDQFYEEGATREAVPAEVAHLVGLGVLEKAAPKPKNKAEPVVTDKVDPLDHDRDGRKGGVVKAKG